MGSSGVGLAYPQTQSVVDEAVAAAAPTADYSDAASTAEQPIGHKPNPPCLYPGHP